MNAPYHHIDYATTRFQYPVLTKIHGAPTYKTLTTLKKELKANAQSVGCNLGGGAHGHLGLILTPNEYATVSNTPYEAPHFPAPLDFARNIETAAAVQQQTAYLEAIRLFREVTDVTKTLINQIVGAIDEMYLHELCDEATSRIAHSIPEILHYLFENFADVSAEHVSKEEAALHQFHWNIADPPMVFFTLIDDFQKLATAAGLTRSASMLIALGINIIRKTGDFEKALLEWYELDDEDKTWPRFKSHFNAAHKALRKVRGKTIRSTSYFQANQVIAEVNSNINKMKTDILENMSLLHNQSQPYDSSSLSSPTLPTQASSVTSSNVSNAELLTLIQQLQQQLATQTPDPKKPSKRIITNYCWTHGACGHPSKLCRNKKPGHQDEATFDDKMGGSTYYCKIAADQFAKKSSAT